MVAMVRNILERCYCGYRLPDTDRNDSARLA